MRLTNSPMLKSALKMPRRGLCPFHLVKCGNRRIACVQKVLFTDEERKIFFYEKDIKNKGHAGMGLGFISQTFILNNGWWGGVSIFPVHYLLSRHGRTNNWDAAWRQMIGRSGTCEDALVHSFLLPKPSSLRGDGSLFLFKLLRCPLLVLTVTC